MKDDALSPPHRAKLHEIIFEADTSVGCPPRRTDPVSTQVCPSCASEGHEIRRMLATGMPNAHQS